MKISIVRLASVELATGDMIGQSIVRNEESRFVNRERMYLYDIKIPGLVSAGFVRLPFATPMSGCATSDAATARAQP